MTYGHAMQFAGWDKGGGCRQIWQITMLLFGRELFETSAWITKEHQVADCF
jgi:hypothetical protein